jgi:hypothetical protein
MKIEVVCRLPAQTQPEKCSQTLHVTDSACQIKMRKMLVIELTTIAINLVVFSVAANCIRLPFLLAIALGAAINDVTKAVMRILIGHDNVASTSALAMALVRGAFHIRIATSLKASIMRASRSIVQMLDSECCVGHTMTLVETNATCVTRKIF